MRSSRNSCGRLFREADEGGKLGHNSGKISVHILEGRQGSRSPGPLPGSSCPSFLCFLSTFPIQIHVLPPFLLTFFFRPPLPLHAPEPEPNVDHLKGVRRQHPLQHPYVHVRGCTQEEEKRRCAGCLSSQTRQLHCDPRGDWCVPVLDRDLSCPHSCLP